MNSLFLSREEIDPIEWDALIADSPEGCLFAKSWYLDAVLDREWKAVAVREQNRLIAVMPLFISRKWFIYYAHQPMLTRYLGIFFARRDFENNREKYSWKKKVIKALLDGIPSLSSVITSFHPAFDYPQPFIWQGYTLGNRFTCVLDMQKDYATLREDFDKGLKKKLRKAEEEGLFIRAETLAEPVLLLLKENSAQGRELIPKPYHGHLEKVFAACQEKKSCNALSVYNAQQELMASAWFLNDEHTTYFLAGYSSPAFRQSAAMPFLTAEGIGQASQKSRRFDFMGSMVESIESYFRSFGAQPLPFFIVSKKNIWPW